MYNGIMIAAKSSLAPPELAGSELPDDQHTDARLAAQYPDLRLQLQQPSLARHQFDANAPEHEKILESGRLTEYFFSQHTLCSINHQTLPFLASYEGYATLLRDAYDKSPTFRRLFNFAAKQQLNDDAQRCALNIDPALASTKPHSTQLPINAEDHPHFYPSEKGQQISDRQRTGMTLLLPILTRLPVREAGHARGPIIEYTNIILKEMGNTSPACIRLLNEDDPAGLKKTSASQAMRTILNSTLSPAERISKRLDEQANKRRNLLKNRNNPVVLQSLSLRSKMWQDIRAIDNYRTTLLPLLATQKNGETTLQSLEKIAIQNQETMTFRYNISKKRDPFEMITDKNGDCTSFCQLYMALAEACDLRPLDLYSLDRPFSFQLSDPAEITGAAPNQQMTFASHTILRLQQEDGTIAYFDPVLGKSVNPDHYGDSLATYLN